jgi:acyl-CoA dehydrogenase
MKRAVDKPESSFMLNPMDELNDLRMSANALPLLEHVKQFIAETVNPMSDEFERLGRGKVDIWSYAQVHAGGQ